MIRSILKKIICSIAADLNRDSTQEAASHGHVAAPGTIGAEPGSSDCGSWSRLAIGSKWEGSDIRDIDGIGIVRSLTDFTDHVSIERCGERLADLFPRDLATFMLRNYPWLFPRNRDSELLGAILNSAIIHGVRSNAVVSAILSAEEEKSK